MYFCLMNKKERYQLFVEHFSEHQPVAVTELEYNNPYELLFKFKYEGTLGYKLNKMVFNFSK